MASPDDYSVGWVCALPVEAAAAKATLDRIHDTLTPDQNGGDSNNYILGSLRGHNVVLAYPDHGVYGETSVAGVATQLRARFKSIRFNLMIGIAGGVPDTKEDIRLGDVVVSKSTAGTRSVIQCDANGERSEDQSDQPTSFFLTATGKTETAAIFAESQLHQYVSEIVRKDPTTFAHHGSEEDVLFESTYTHTNIGSEEDGCHLCDPDKIRPRRPRETQDPIVHYGRIASGRNLTRLPGATRDNLAHKQSVLCLDTAAAGLKDAQYLLIRGICDYADSHSSKSWHAYAAVAAAAYAKEILSFIPTVPKAEPLVVDAYVEAAPVLDALLLTRPKVDRKSLISLKGRRVDGTCEWLIQHPSYQKWLVDADSNVPLLWISGGPGKGKTMLAIYITEALQPVIDAAGNVLLYYFCSNRDKNRNTALTILRGIIHQWIDLHPHLAQYIKASFEGTETTKYTVSSFVSLWRVFQTLLEQSKTSQVVCVLDGLDECEKESLRQLLDAIGNYLSKSRGQPKLKLILLSRPQPAVLESRLNRYQQIKLDDSGTEISYDVERYIVAKVTELATAQNLSEEMVAQVQKTLFAGANGTFLWVGFVTNELEGQSWSKIDEILQRVPKGLGGVYQRLLQQIDDKEALVPILQWIVLAARPLTIDELTVATGIEASGTFSAAQVVKNRLRLCGLLVKIDGNVVNLVHESAKEFFQSDQINIQGISTFRMDHVTHRTLLRTCLAHIERGYGSNIDEESGNNSLVAYASQYWPVHFHHAIDVIDLSSELSHPFFDVDSPIRDEWWKFYWVQEKNGGNAPSFTLLHLAAYLGNVPWAKILMGGHARLVSRRDNYGRTPFFWAVNRGHREMAELLLDHGSRINAKDRSKLTALHIAVSGQHKDIVSLLLDRGAPLEGETEHGDTPLIRAIQTNSREVVQVLLEHGARVHKLPTLPGVTSLKGPTAPMEERVSELLGLQEQLFLARFKQASRKVDRVMKALTLSFHFPIILRFMTLYLKFLAFNRWEHLSVLQQLVEENKTDELRQWAEAYRRFFCQLIFARNAGRLSTVFGLSTKVYRAAAPRDLQALLAVGVLAGSQAKLTAVQEGWREGDAIAGKAFADMTAIAYSQGAEEFLHYGVRDFLNGFDASVRNGNREENVARAVVLLTSQFAMLDNKEPRPIEYFSRVIAEFYEGYIGGSLEMELFADTSQAYADELLAISEHHDYPRLLDFLTCILQFAQRSQEKGQDRFLNIPCASCLILCHEDAEAHQWLIGEALPEAMSALISKQTPGPLQRRACKALVECLIIGKQYGLGLPAAALTQRLKPHLNSLPGVESMITQVVGS